MTPTSREDPGLDRRAAEKHTQTTNPESGPRTKRVRYVPNACNECKRRKVKCDGEEPCQRCTTSTIPCSYQRPQRNINSAPAPAHIANANPASRDGFQLGGQELDDMSTQLSNIMAKLNALRRGASPKSVQGAAQHPPSSYYALPNVGDQTISPVALSVQPAPELPVSIGHTTEKLLQEMTSPEYHGPTSTEFTFEVANETLSDLGLGDSVRKLDQYSQPLMPLSTTSQQAIDNIPLRKLLGRSVLWNLRREDALKYTTTYHSTIGAMYPVTNGSHYISKVKQLFDTLDLAKRQGQSSCLGRMAELVYSNETEILKIQIAIGMITELGPSGTSPATELVQSVHDSFDDSFLNAQGVFGVQILVTMALFYYNLDQEAKASRYSCLASRCCLELGLHRRETFTKQFPSAEARQNCLKVFWSAFTLDRRSSLGLGIPFVMQDSIIDPTLTSLNLDHDYLRAMIPFAKLSGKAWLLGNEFSSKAMDLVREEIDYLDYQVTQWQKQIPPSLQYHPDSAETSGATDGNDDASQRFYLSVVLFARMNQLRNIIHRPILQSTSSIESSPLHTSTALRIAKQSLKAFSNLHANTKLLHNHATFFKHFIISSLGNALLIAVHATREYWEDIQETFKLASTLLKNLSTRSIPVLWACDRLRNLDDLQARILAARRMKASLPDEYHYSGPTETRSGDSHVRGDEEPLNLIDTFVGDDFMLFDSQIRSEFGTLFDPTYSSGLLADYISSEQVEDQ